ncbi:hypothetical protein ANANG_G00071790 [Anguilla anguilla]|uniref:Uncharacterized protein n=1 Tax=Anguilla anguilla TaxID=7936 RepID=A0A9D3MQK4_ANGAN|nr:hypothetical protein ANANG_G00071790 [Anguilla anguilla]
MASCTIQWGSVTSPPPPAMPKYKLAEYRYGREEMLALYVKDNKVPEDMQDKEFSAILQDEPLQPLALVPLTEEEQRNFSMSVNSVAVLRLMGKGGGAIPAGVPRGRGSTRGGRGRGRGEGGFYQRSIEDGEVGFSRTGREIHRSQSWDDRGERRFEKPLRRDGVRVGFEARRGASRTAEGRTLRGHEARTARAGGWRTLREEHEEEEGHLEPGGSWRLAGAPQRRAAGSEGLEDERDGLPEWCTDEEDGEMGTFDSSGAFLPIKKGSKDPIPEELDFQGLEDEEEEGSPNQERKDSGGEREVKEAAVSVEREAKSVSPFSPALSAPSPGQRAPDRAL